MTPQQIRTVKRLGVALAIATALVAWLLYTEGAAIVHGGHSTITDVVQLAWAHQPWVILLLVVLLVGIAAFLLGHFVAAPEGHYEKLRRGVTTTETLPAFHSLAGLAPEMKTHAFVGYGDPDKTPPWPGEVCKRCGRRNCVGFDVPEWAAVVRDRWTVLCPTCFDEEAQAAGIPYSFGEVSPVSWSDWRA